MAGMEQETESGTALRDQVAAAAGDARVLVGSAAESVRTKSGALKSQLADALDSGASVIRQRASAASPAEQGDGAATGDGEAALPRLAAQGELAASVMERGASWLRENDLSALEGRVLGQLEQHPVRTLGIAAAVGFLVAGRRR